MEVKKHKGKKAVQITAIIGMILVVFLTTACGKLNENSATITSEPSDRNDIETIEPSNTPSTTEEMLIIEPTLVNLTPEEEKEMALELLYSMSQEELLLQILKFSNTGQIRKLIGWGYESGKITQEQIEEAWNVGAEGLTFRRLELTDESFTVVYYDENKQSSHDSTYLWQPELYNEYVSLYRDLILYDNPDDSFYQRYSNIPSTVIGTYDNQEPWEFIVDNYGRNYGGIVFFDRLFIILDSENYIIDPQAVLFVSECYNVAQAIITDSSKSDEQKMEAISAIYFESDLFTPFEKMGMLHYCKGLFDELYDKDTFSTVIVNGQTVDKAMESLKVSNIFELEAVLEKSVGIIEEFRNSGTIPDINLD